MNDIICSRPFSICTHFRISRASYALWDSYHACSMKKVLYHVSIVTLY